MFFWDTVYFCFWLQVLVSVDYIVSLSVQVYRIV